VGTAAEFAFAASFATGDWSRSSVKRPFPFTSRGRGRVRSAIQDTILTHRSGQGGNSFRSMNTGPSSCEQGQDGSNGLPTCATLGGPTGSRGWVRNVTNQLQYQDGSAVMQSGITMADTITISTPNGLGLSGTSTGSFPTTGDGSFPDTYFDCSKLCFGSSSTASAVQSWTWNGTGLFHTNGLVYSCSSITIDGKGK